MEEEKKLLEEQPTEDVAVPPAPPDEEEDAPLTPEQAQRAADMTRTVQITIEQIMAESEKKQAEAAETEPSSAEEPQPPVEDGEDAGEDTDYTLTDRLQDGAKGLAKWLLLVVLFVSLIAGAGVAWLYRSATPDMMPQITVSFAGQEPEVTAYKWKIPVVGHLFRRTYAKTLSSKPVELASPIEDIAPRLTVSPADYSTRFTVTDSSGLEVYSDSAEKFSDFRFTANGTYTGLLIIERDKASADETEVTGSETRLFTFTVSHCPSVRVSPTLGSTGGVAAVCVGKTLDGQAPVLQTAYPHTEFMQTTNGWVSCLPLAWDETPGNTDITVQADGFTQTVTLSVRAAERPYKDYYSERQRVSPYIGEEDVPAKVKACFSSSLTEPLWKGTGFAAPFEKYDTVLAYGTTEYVGRSYAERSENPGTGGRTAVNVVVSTVRGADLTAPAAGKVVLAQELDEPYGKTLVIDHGCGLVSVFYGLRELQAKAGDTVTKGQVLAACSRTTVAELRLCGVAIDPEAVWQNRCDAFKQF